MLRIDKSKFDAEQLALYEELMAIGKADVDPESAEDEMEDDKPTEPSKKTEKAEVDNMEETKKSAPEVDNATALEAVQKELAEFRERVEKQEFVGIAKKYAPLGKKEDELGEQLYNLHKSDKASYDAFVGILDEHLALVEKSGMFAEIGKSAGGQSGDGTVQGKVNAKAAEIRKANPGISHSESIAKAWEDPELFAEYDAEYNHYR